ncbi:MAG: ATP-binding protein [Candidatus Thorarchaeota archaeon]
MSQEQSFFEVKDPEIYRKLQKHLDKLPIGLPSTQSGVELKLLKFIFTPKEAQVAINLRFVPEPLKTIYRRVKKFDITQEQLEGILERMHKKGAIRITRIEEHDTYKNLYQNWFLVVGMFEYQVGRMTKEFYENFEQYMEEGFREEFMSTKINQLRTIPVEKSIEPHHNIATYDLIRELIEDAENISVEDCICKKGKDLLGNPCKQTKTREHCFTFNSSAINAVYRGYGRLISKTEALKIIEKAQEDGLIIQPTNSQKPNYVCCCCGCCCDLLVNLKKIEKPYEFIYSNYFAEVEVDLCIGCKTCLDRCQMDAIELMGDIAAVNLEKCIGCGNCVVSCPEKAISLVKKDTDFVPPTTTKDLFLQIMKKSAELRNEKKGRINSEREMVYGEK